MKTAKTNINLNKLRVMFVPRCFRCIRHIQQVIGL